MDNPFIEQQRERVGWDSSSATVYSLRLPYPISANRYWQSFVPPGSRIATVHLSSEAKAYKREVGWLAKAAGMREPLTCRTSIEIDLYPHRPLDWAKRVKRDAELWADSVQCIDLGNALKVLEDALEGIAYVNDKQAHRISLQRCDPDEYGARVEVRIAPYLTPKWQPDLIA